nr:GH24 muramidase [Trichophaea saccata]
MHALTLLTATLFGLAAAYPVKTDLHCRSSPSTSASIVRTYSSGTEVQIQCQTTGTSVQGSNVWDKTQHGCYVADYYVKTGHSGIFTTKCGSSSGGGSCKPPPINAATVALIKEFEGFVPKPAPDPIGLPTVGYGHLCKTKGCKEVPYSFPLTQETATKLLQSDIKTFTSCVSNYVKDSVKLNDNQYGALASWAFNVGCGNVQTSSLIKRLNAGENPNTVAAQELPKWKYAGGKVMPGLVRRRNAEVALFKKPSSVQAHPPKC